MGEEGKALYQRLFEGAINQGRFETVDELVAPSGTVRLSGEHQE